MRPVQVYANLNDHQYGQLINALRGPWRSATRAMMVLLSARGMTPTEIGELLDYHPRTVRNWISRHAAEGVAGLTDRPRPGRPRLGSARLGQRIRKLLTRPKAWTITGIHRALGRPKLGMRTMYRRVREVASWRQPRLVARGDPDRDQICAQLRAQVAALPPGSVVLAEDETHLDLLARLRACWQLRGTRFQVWTPGSNQRRSLFGAVNLLTGAFHYHLAFKAVSVTFCYFLQTLLDAYPNAPVVAVICDNVSTHTSKITKQWLEQHPRLQLLHGARYSPQDNPSERMWAALKKSIANTACTTMAERVRQTHAFFRHRSPEQNLTTTAPWTSPWLPKSYGKDFWPRA
jgi:transposase